MKFLAVLLSVLTSLQAAAEPSGLVRKLMNTETTMFEMGLLRIERMLSASSDLKDYSVSYDWKRNQIHISNFMFSSEQAEVFCGEGAELKCIDYFKRKLKNETRTLCRLSKKGECLFGVGFRFASRGFLRENFYDGKNSNDATRLIDDITVASIYYYGDTYIVDCEKFIKSEEVKCSSKRVNK